MSVVLETLSGGNITVYTALPTDIRLHPTYSKVKAMFLLAKIYLICISAIQVLCIKSNFYVESLAVICL